MSAKLKIELGTGPGSDKMNDPDWKTNDIRAFPGIDFVSPCYELHMIQENSVDELFARGLVEHLTYKEVALGLVEWKRILKPTGLLIFDVPDLQFYFDAYSGKLGKKLQDSAAGGGDTRDKQEPQDYELCSGRQRWLRRILWGWQRWPGDEHKSGWTEKLIRGYVEKYFGPTYELERYGGHWGNTTAIVKHLWLRCRKS